MELRLSSALFIRNCPFFSAFAARPPTPSELALENQMKAHIGWCHLKSARSLLLLGRPQHAASDLAEAEKLAAQVEDEALAQALSDMKKALPCASPHPAEG
eukprot:TRINITY_DN3064_c0_g1_i3.p4 TRINITY_DN3064_c0_g1~~TRINITY_DN3064_c0_g1_i3.p4  ORF type:complete len:101 (-),score=21.70 TRINITY_DN3064_c0_g1_i3:342-644(-)